MELYEQQGLVARVDGNQDIEAVFRHVVSGLKSVQEQEVLDANRLAVAAVCAGDVSAYAEVSEVPGAAYSTVFCAVTLCEFPVELELSCPVVTVTNF